MATAAVNGIEFLILFIKDLLVSFSPLPALYKTDIVDTTVSLAARPANSETSSLQSKSRGLNTGAINFPICAIYEFSRIFVFITSLSFCF